MIPEKDPITRIAEALERIATVLDGNDRDGYRECEHRSLLEAVCNIDDAIDPGGDKSLGAAMWTWFQSQNSDQDR